MHTTASDGRLTPAELVARAAAAGLTTISVTDHDTVAALAEVTAAAQPQGIRVIPGIEITAIDDGRDVHVLGYFFDPASAPLAALLVSQRALRVARVTRDRRHGSRRSTCRWTSTACCSAAAAARIVGRPSAARARAGARRPRRVGAGRVRSSGSPPAARLSCRAPARAPRTSIDTIHDAGGVASFAHPGVTKRDELIAPLVDHGLDAIEVYHSDHTPEDVIEYKGLATRLGVLVTGGSDFHGDDPPPSTASAPRRADPRRRDVARRRLRGARSERLRGARRQGSGGSDDGSTQ